MNEHQVMTEKMLKKYNITGGAKKFLTLLGESVQSDNLENELNFTKLLPSQMAYTVLDEMWNR